MPKKKAKYLQEIDPKAPEKPTHYIVGLNKPPGLYDNLKHKLLFSFKSINLNTSILCFNNPHLTPKDYHSFLLKIKELEEITYQAFKDGTKYYRFHTVDFNNGSVSWTLNDFKKAISINYAVLEDDNVPTCYQFDVFEEARALGYLGYNGIFHLVWFDRTHSTYKRK